MTKTIIMWSGGADSTVIVDQMLRNTADELLLQHIVIGAAPISDSDDVSLVGGIRRRAAICAAQVVAVKQITNYWKQEGYRPFTLDISYYQPPAGHLVGSALVNVLSGVFAAQHYNADRFITGVGPISVRNGNALAAQQLKQLQDTFDVLMQGRKKSIKVRNDMSLPGEKAVIVLGDSDYSHVKWEKPLAEWGWGKRGVVKRLPPKLRRLVVSCDYPTTHEDHWERCGKCFRCNKWEQVGGLVDGDDDV